MTTGDELWQTIYLARGEIEAVLPTCTAQQANLLLEYQEDFCASSTTLSSDYIHKSRGDGAF